MEVTSTKAALVANGDVEAQSRLSVTLPRSEVEAALAEPEPPELILDVLRATGEERDAEQRKISVEWDPADIKLLLEKTPGEGITFSFDRDELDRLLSDDMELHGMRDKALVLSVAVGIAAAGTTSAMAGPGDPTGPPTGRTAPVASVSSHDELTPQQRGIETVAPSQKDEAGSTARGIEPTVASAPDEAGLTARGIEPTVASAPDEAGLTARGIEPTVASAPDEAGLTARGIEPTVASAPDEAGLTGRGIEPTSVSRPDEATLAQRGIPDSVVGKPDEASLAQRGIQTPAVSTPEVAAASDAPTIDPSTAAALGIAGGMGLLIVGAAFVARRQRAMHPA
jgi:hypothetical protein